MPPDTGKNEHLMRWLYRSSGGWGDPSHIGIGQPHINLWRLLQRRHRYVSISADGGDSSPPSDGLTARDFLLRRRVTHGVWVSDVYLQPLHLNPRVPTPFTATSETTGKTRTGLSVPDSAAEEGVGEEEKGEADPKDWLRYRLVDLSTSHQRDKKLIHAFDDLSHCIFCVPLHHYDLGGACACGCWCCVKGKGVFLHCCAVCCSFLPLLICTKSAWGDPSRSALQSSLDLWDRFSFHRAFPSKCTPPCHFASLRVASLIIIHRHLSCCVYGTGSCIAYSGVHWIGCVLSQV